MQRDSMELKPSNSNILEQLRHGFARFELVSTPSSPVSDSISSTSLPASFLGSTQGNSYVFFASFSGFQSRAAKKVEQYAKHEVTEDHLCLFRALAKGMAFNEGRTLDPQEETDCAVELRMAVKKVICNDQKEREKYEEALLAIKMDDVPLPRYCQRIGSHDFLGGRSELLVISKLYEQPIIVYLPAQEGKQGKGGYIQHDEYGAEFRGGWEKGRRTRMLLASGFDSVVDWFRRSGGEEKKKKNVVIRLVYSNNHYDLLL